MEYDWRARVIFEDERLLIVDKPPGIASTGRVPEDEAAVQGQLMAWLGRALYAPHQLDKGTSGVLVFTKKRSELRALNDRFAKRQVRKVYLAVVHGAVPRDALSLDGEVGGKPAFTRVVVLERASEFTLVEARPRTGRTHQIRVHLADAGHPIAGEDRYVDPPSAAHPRLALHAARLSLDEERNFEAPMPADLKALWARLAGAG